MNTATMMPIRTLTLFCTVALLDYGLSACSGKVAAPAGQGASENGVAGADGAACLSTSFSAQKYVDSRTCFQPPDAVTVVCIRHGVTGRSVSAVCGLAPDGNAYVGTLGTSDWIGAAGWTFAMDGSLGISLDGQPLNAGDHDLCQRAITAWLQTPRWMCN